MGEKDDVKKETNEKKTIDADETKKVDEGPITTVVLKLDLHCDGCAKKVKKSIRYIEGVKSVKADSTNNKLTITGKVNPIHIKERVEFKTKKKVELLSPKPKKDDESDKKAEAKPAETKTNDQKPKEPQSTTVVLKISLHCDGCIQKIKRIISKIDGVDSVKPDSDKNLVTVKGTMNMNELIPYLKDKLKRNVAIVPPKKEENKGDEKKDEKKVEGDDVVKKMTEKEGENNADDKKNDAEKEVGNITESGEQKKNDDAKTTDDGSDKKKPLDDKTKTTSGGDRDGTKNVDVTNKFEYYRHNPYTYTMHVYNQTYHNQDYGVPVFPSHGYGNDHGYVSHGYVMQYPHGPPPPPSPMSIHNPRASETDMFNADNPNACSIM